MPEEKGNRKSTYLWKSFKFLRSQAIDLTRFTGCIYVFLIKIHFRSLRQKQWRLMIRATGSQKLQSFFTDADAWIITFFHSFVDIQSDVKKEIKKRSMVDRHIHENVKQILEEVKEIREVSTSQFCTYLWRFLPNNLHQGKFSVKNSLWFKVEDKQKALHLVLSIISQGVPSIISEGKEATAWAIHIETYDPQSSIDNKWPSCGYTRDLLDWNVLISKA